MTLNDAYAHLRRRHPDTKVAVTCTMACYADGQTWNDYATWYVHVDSACGTGKTYEQAYDECEEKRQRDAIAEHAQEMLVSISAPGYPQPKEQI